MIQQNWFARRVANDPLSIMLDYQRASTVDECWFPKLSAYLRVGSSPRLQVLPIPPDFPVPKDPKEDFTVTFGPCANLMIYTGHECHEAMGILCGEESLLKDTHENNG